MNILNRLKKLESQSNQERCFCSQTLLDLWRGKTGAAVLTYCLQCKDKFNQWVKVSASAKLEENLTNEH